MRYADDFVVLCRTEAEANEAHTFSQGHLAALGLTLSAEKTKITRFAQGFQFLGFRFNSRYVTMREKSVEKFKAKIRTLTTRSHNFDARVVVKVNQLVRGVANYFATSFSSVSALFEGLDGWLRMRLRCMKVKTKCRSSNYKLRTKHLRKMGFIFLNDLNPRVIVDTS